MYKNKYIHFYLKSNYQLNINSLLYGKIEQTKFLSIYTSIYNI